MGVIYILGMGPGSAEYFTEQMKRAVDDSDLIIGYTVYVDLLKKAYPDKIYESTGMKQELNRCRLAYERALEGKNVALICSGDAGVYGMASPMYELLPEYPGVELVVIPGITAALSGAAILGAPVNHDFCLISLSDLLTPLEQIKKRLKAAVFGNFVVVLYNPASHHRKDYLKRAVEYMMEEGASPDLACGYVERIGREGEHGVICTLEELKDAPVNMFTTVFIGNSESYHSQGKLITKRGYHE
ncbi:MAG: precorrin-3B C(17)-methyltransferase [Lachnospiraceae bacterium]|nr:precorrin-3B C(17)-methyltransferase [Lachnospiraceae bacterium]